MEKITVVKKNSFSIIPNGILRNQNLSLKAIGLYCKVYSLPDGWQYSQGGLCSICKENITAIKSALKELQNENYLIVKKFLPSKSNGGKFSYEYIFYDEPQEVTADNTADFEQDTDFQGVENQGIGFLCLENQELENPPLYINKDNQKKIIKEKNIKKKNPEIESENESEKTPIKKELDLSAIPVDLLTDFKKWLEVYEYTHGNGKPMHQIQLEIQIEKLLRIPADLRHDALKNATAGAWKNILDPRKTQKVEEKRKKQFNPADPSTYSDELKKECGFI